MKKIITCIALLIVANSIYSQQNNPSATLTKKDYMMKSKNQKTAAWLFMGGGLGLTVLGLTADNENSGTGDHTGKIVALVSGIAAISVGTIFFINSANNKKRGEMLSFRMEKAPLIQQGGFVYRSYPALSFRLNL
jgi:hypothetical protein